MAKVVQKDSATWRAVVTALQTFVAFFVTLVALPEVRELLTEFYPAVVPAVTFFAGVASFVLNYFRKDVPNV